MVNFSLNVCFLKSLKKLQWNKIFLSAVNVTSSILLQFINYTGSSQTEYLYSLSSSSPSELLSVPKKVPL